MFNAGLTGQLLYFGLHDCTSVCMTVLTAELHAAVFIRSKLLLKKGVSFQQRKNLIFKILFERASISTHQRLSFQHSSCHAISYKLKIYIHKINK